MNSLIQNTVSFLEKRIAARQLSAAGSRVDTIVSGYSFLSDVNRSECLPEGSNRHQCGIFYADVANYSGDAEQEDEGTHHRLVESMKIMQAYVNANNGRVVHTAGDAILAEFKDVDSALYCAVNVQLAAREMNAGLREDQRVLFRIGVNFGDGIADNSDIYSNAIDLAACLQKLAKSGGICVCESVRSELENNPSFHFVALGNQYVNNISEPVQAFWIEIDAEQVADADCSGALKVSVMAS